MIHVGDLGQHMRRITLDPRLQRRGYIDQSTSHPRYSAALISLVGSAPTRPLSPGAALIRQKSKRTARSPGIGEAGSSFASTTSDSDTPNTVSESILASSPKYSAVTRS